jgi:hypothetical protein
MSERFKYVAVGLLTISMLLSVLASWQGKIFPFHIVFSVMVLVIAVCTFLLFAEGKR